MDISNLFLIFQIFVVIFVGAALGSFASAIIYRVANGQSWIFTKEDGAARSQCPLCKHVLGIQDLIPLFSWLFQKGRCRYCTGAISWFYPVLEISTVALVGAVYFIFGFSITGVLLMGAIPFILSQGVLFFRDGVFSLQLFIIITCFLCLIGTFQIFQL